MNWLRLKNKKYKYLKGLVVSLAVLCVLSGSSNLPMLIVQAQDAGTPSAEELLAIRLAEAQAEMAAREAEAAARQAAAEAEAAARQAAAEAELAARIESITNPPAPTTETGTGDTGSGSATDLAGTITDATGATGDSGSAGTGEASAAGETGATGDIGTGDTGSNGSGTQDSQNTSNSEGNQIISGLGCPETGCSEEKNITTNDSNSSENNSNSGNGSSATNDSTGDDSTNSSSATSSSDTGITNENDTEMTNSASTEANSGDNTLEFENRGEGGIESGDANAEIGVDTTANTNNTAVWSSGGAHLSWPEDNLAGNSNTGDDSLNEASVDVDRSLSIINRNNALINNEFEVKGNSGRNDILAGYKFKDGGIKTGDVNTKANVMNLINTNLVNSKFVPLVLNITDEWVGDLNLMQLLFERFGANFEGALGGDALNMNTGEDSYNGASVSVDEEYNVENENRGLIYNDIVNSGISGRNKILSGYKIKDANLKTGAVNVTTNLFNFLNTNLVGAEWVVTVINVFGDWSGNLILPRPQEIFPVVPTAGSGGASASISGAGEDSLNSAVAFQSSDINVTNFNDAQVETEVINEVNTGSNKMHFGHELEEADMNSGSAKSQVNQMTLANRNVYGGGWFSSMFNVLGEWTGRIVGLPGGALVQGSDNQFMISTEEPEYKTGLVPDGTNGAGATATINGTGEDSVNVAESEFSQRVTINNNNEGKIVNKVSVEADSGSNIMEGEKGKRVKIDTGTAKASTNVANFLNTNIIGGKMVNVVVNTFGKWKGDLSFGESVDLADTLTGGGNEYYLPGQIINYTLTVTNKGPETAEGVQATATYDAQKTDVVSAGGGEVSNGTITWPVGTLAAGESKQLTFSLQVKPTLAGGSHLVETIADVTAAKADRDTRDNKSRAAILVNSDGSDSGGSGGNGGSGDTGGDTGGSGGDTGGSTGGSDNNSGGSGGTGSGESPVNAAGNNSSGGGSSGGSSGTTMVSGGSIYLTKTNNAGSQVKPGSVVQYKIAVQNSNPNSIYRAYVYDKLTYNGKVVLEKSWPLQEVYAWEKLVIEYEVNIAPDAPGGQYVNKAYLSGFDANNNLVKSEYAESTITVEGATGASASGTISSGGPDNNATGVTDPANPATGVTTPATNDSQTQNDWQYVELNETRTVEPEVTAPVIKSPEKSVSLEERGTLLRYIPTAQAASEENVTATGEVLGEETANADNTETVAKEKAMPIIYGLDLDSEPQPASSFQTCSWLWILLLLLIIWSVYQFWKDNQRNRQL